MARKWLLPSIVCMSLVIPTTFIKAQHTIKNLDSLRRSNDSINKLDEVVVTALGVRREKRNLTYSTQEIKGSDLLKTQEPSVLNAMSGKVAGVQLNSTSGAPGAATSIVIRGISSILGNNQALIVLDGVPINNSERDGGGDGGAGTSGLSDIDPSIIENINVLKGAAATALYGSAGARGVVLITTKNGAKNRKPTVTVSSIYSQDHAILPPRQMTYAQGDGGVYIDGENTKTSLSWGPNIDSLKAENSNVQFHNPLKEFFKTGKTNTNTVSVSGGNATSDYVASYSFLDQTGTVPNTSFTKNNFFLKYRTEIIPKLSLTTSINYSYSKNRFANQGYGLQSPLTTLYSAPISYDFFPIYNDDGSQRLYRYSRDNPYWVLDNVGNVSGVSRLIPVVTMNYNVLPWMTITERIGADISSDKYNYHVNIGDVSYADGRLVSRDANNRQINQDFIIQMNHDFKDFKISGLVGNNILTTNYDQMQTTGTGLTTNGYYNMANASTITYSEYNTLTRKIGFYAQGELDYKRFLILSLSGRYDGSSVLSTAKQFYPYGSAALGFVFTDLIKGSFKNVMNFGKVRVSYASVGNDNVSAYSNITPFYQASTNITWPYSGQNGFLSSDALGNSTLKNELQREFEVGFESKFFNSRVGIEASYYVRNMSDGLVQGIAIANSTGYSSTTINSAKIRTSGLELLLTGTPIKTKDFNWEVTINYSNPKTIVKQIGGGLTSTNIGFTYAVEGQKYAMQYGSVYARDSKGNLLVDASGLPYTEANGYLGSAMANWSGGIINNFRYKQFSWGFQFDTRQGGVIQNTDDYYNLYYGISKRTENRADFVVKGIDAATGEENTKVVKAESYYQRISGITEALIQHSSYIKLRNVNINYTLNNSIFKKSPFKEATITLTGRNLWIWHNSDFTGSDPESNNTFGTGNGSIGVYTFGTPTNRSYSVALKLLF
ncbi:SusC/RagA family TonB-linked outer membrane protein [Rhizosphaericola mali]|uniref:SusC/RagA family TonB-linked outer membrane protein n=1 Tax=Rhizosphaericola mali TaxID=2545455 RepID=A0A5P2G5N5_9BACT|nr:SusC/RagA family TonB-linked outer membrane protein [Rhizosphaericola mali]QES89132.1 SusC/RagA family TonB-linked outer membrane protein [Rhizosphaericola mali]